MKTTNNTILITGGSAGIGLELAKKLIAAGNKVIITGRNAERLEKAKAALGNVTTITSDVSDEAEIARLVKRIETDFPELNIVINNAGSAYYYNLSSATDIANKAKEEIQTNYLSIIHLNEKLLPVLKQAKDAAIVNVSSIVAFVPAANIPTYSASKAALHAYTRTLRLAMKGTSVKVFELMPPLVNTDFSKEIGGENGIPPSAVADQLFDALQNDEYEVRVGQTADMYKFSLASPDEAFNTMNANRG